MNLQPDTDLNSILPTSSFNPPFTSASTFDPSFALSLGPPRPAQPAYRPLTSAPTDTSPVASSSRTSVTVPVSGRPPRSRKNRPCDACRKGKTRCTISPAGPPCTQCLETRRTCTFDLAPPPRKPRASVNPSDRSRDAGGDGLLLEDTNYGSAGFGEVGPSERDKRARSGSRSDNSCSPSSAPPDQRRRRLEQSHTIDDDGRRSSSISTTGLDILATAVPSFDHLASSDFEPHVLTNPLTDDLLPVTNDRESPVEKEEDRRPYVKQLSSDPLRPVFVVLNPKAANSRPQSPGRQALFQLRSIFNHYPTRVAESDILDRYHNQIHPASPILPTTSTAQLPPNLLAPVLTTALSHNKATRALAPLAQSIVNSSASYERGNDMTTVIEAILKLDMRPSQTSQSAYLLLSKTIALAQLLGMHLSPVKWSIPVWERELRIRLWWKLEIHDAWMSFLNSRPSHIQERNSSVPIPSLSSVLLAGCAYSSASSDSAKSFIASCRLARLVSRLQRQVSTLGAVSSKTAAERGEEVVSVMKLADRMLEEWKEFLKDGKLRATGRIEVELEHGFGAMFDPAPEILAPFTDCVEFIERLTDLDLDGYYLNYASHILSSVTSSLIRFTLASPSSPNETATNLVGRLIRTLHKLHSVHDWDIAGPALRRAASVSDRLKGSEEHDHLCQALRGSTTSTPNQLDVALAQPQPVDASFPQTVEPQMVWDWGSFDLDFSAFLNG